MSVPLFSSVSRRVLVSRIVGTLGVLGLVAMTFIWLMGSRNPYTPAGYVGYLTKGAVFGKARFQGVQRGPTSAGRQWLVNVANISVTPYTYSEDFVDDDSVLSRDNLKISFKVHTVWRVDDTKVPLFMERYSTTVSRATVEHDPDSIVNANTVNATRPASVSHPAARLDRPDCTSPTTNTTTSSANRPASSAIGPCAAWRSPPIK